MNLYHLRYFVTLAHLEHYTKAADVLAITQPSLSHAISSLEEELGVKLFEKNGRNVSLTKYGKSFLEDVEQTLNRLDSSVNGLQLAGKGEGQIDVAFLRTLGVDFMPKIIRSFKKGEPTDYQRKGQVIEFAVPVRSADVPQIQGAMLVTISCSEITATMMELNYQGLLLIAVIVVLSVFLGYILATVLVKPLARVTKSIEDLTDGYQNDEISVPDYTETELITDAFNKMLARMKVLDESRSEFVSNVSHELKTPMTSMKVLADSLVGQQGVPEELYQEFLQDITAEIDRENRIITDLLSLVKMDKKTADLSIQHMDINQLLEDILKRLRPIADKRSIDLILDSFRPVEADVDEIKFTSAISNLVENAIKYNVDDGWVRVSIDADHKYFYVTVADSGMGIPEDSLERIFERFYRVDKSHSREIGGTGLGLAITRSTIAMHHGVIKVFSREGEGTTFSVRIPLSYIP